MTDDEQYERTLCQLPQAHVFKIPARKSADGHRAADWPTEPIWTGRLKVVARGRNAVIQLIDAENKLFASCPVTDDSAVERCLDSGRYFVLRITNAQNKHAFIGLAFNERNDAFDFNVSLAEHKSECEREDKASQGLDAAPISQLKDLSLKEGEKITVKLSNTGTKKEKKASSGILAPPPGTKTGFLAPPPNDVNLPNTVFSVGNSNQSTIQKPSQAFTTTNSTTTSNDNSFSNFGDFDSAFGSSDPFASSSAVSASSTDPFGFPVSNSVNNPPVTSPSQTTSNSESVNLLDL